MRQIAYYLGGGGEKWERDGLSQPIFHFGYMAGIDFSEDLIV